MKFFYTLAMRYAAVALFVIGLLSAVVALLVGIDTMNMMGESLSRIGNESTYGPWAIGAYARAVAPALDALVWPWLGAAALWRFDGIFLRRRPAAEAAE